MDPAHSGWEFNFLGPRESYALWRKCQDLRQLWLLHERTRSLPMWSMRKYLCLLSQPWVHHSKSRKGKATVRKPLPQSTGEPGLICTTGKRGAFKSNLKWKHSADYVLVNKSRTFKKLKLKKKNCRSREDFYQGYLAILSDAVMVEWVYKPRSTEVSA